MLRFVFKKLRLPAKCSTNGSQEIAATYTLRLGDPFVRTISVSPTNSSEKAQPFTASYLREAFGLQPQAAATVAEKVRLKTTKKPDRVLRVLNDHGLSQSQIADLVVKCPKILTFNADTTLRPKLDYFRSVGFAAHVGGLLVMNSHILSWNLERRTIPCFEFLNSILQNKEHVFHALQFCNQALSSKHAPNIEILRSHGIPEAVILKLLVTRACALTRSPERFASVVEKVKEFGVPSDSLLFAHAVGIMAYYSESAWEERMQRLRSFGWSDAQIAAAMRKQPMFIASSADMLMKKLKFLSDTFGWDSAFLSAHPRVIMVSMTKLVQRSAVLSMLISRGSKEMRDPRRVTTLLRVSDQEFTVFISKYADEMPEVLKAYEETLQLRN